MKKLTYPIFLLFIFSQLVSCTPMTGCIIPMGEGCNSKITFEPDTLPVAIVGESYYAEVKIDGGAVSPSVYGTVTPENNLIVEPIRTGNSYNTMKIYGKPIEATDTVILIHGGTYGTMVSGKEFKKTYTLKVKEKE